MSFIAFVKTQEEEEDLMALVCPEGLLAKGFSWYGQPIIRIPVKSDDAFQKNSMDSQADNILSSKKYTYSQKISMCVNCKPEKESRYQWIEICFANNENILEENFNWETKSCEDQPFDDSDELLPKICQDYRPVCGLTVTIGIPTLKFAIKEVQTIPCTNGITDPTAFTDNQTKSVSFDVGLACPVNSTLFGLERFKLPASDGSIPVLSALCRLNNYTKEHMIFIYAKGKLNDAQMHELFAKSPGCPFNSVLGKGTRCNLKESQSKFCSLRWHSTTSEKPIIDLLKCPCMKIKQQQQESAKENNQYIYIIIGVFVGLLILVIISITLHRVKVNKLRRDDEFKITENAVPNEGINPVRVEQSADLLYEDVEGDQISSLSRTIQRRNQKIQAHNLETIALQSNDKYKYTVPDRIEDTLKYAPEDSSYMKAYMFIK